MECSYSYHHISTPMPSGSMQRDSGSRADFASLDAILGRTIVVGPDSEVTITEDTLASAHARLGTSQAINPNPNPNPRCRKDEP